MLSATKSGRPGFRVRRSVLAERGIRSSFGTDRADDTCEDRRAAAGVAAIPSSPEAVFPTPAGRTSPAVCAEAGSSRPARPVAAVGGEDRGRRARRRRSRQRPTAFRVRLRELYEAMCVEHDLVSKLRIVSTKEVQYRRAAASRPYRRLALGAASEKCSSTGAGQAHLLRRSEAPPPISYTITLEDGRGRDTAGLSFAADPMSRASRPTKAIACRKIRRLSIYSAAAPPPAQVRPRAALHPLYSQAAGAAIAQVMTSPSSVPSQVPSLRARNSVQVPAAIYSAVWSLGAFVTRKLWIPGGGAARR